VRFSGKVARGKRAVTHFQVERRYALASRVVVQLDTGRTHQIRVHFSEAGFPLLGDALYGSRASARVGVIARQALHAWRLALRHPLTGRRLRFEAPEPQDLLDAEARLRAGRW
jgi:23S rRNA pseudouridine1911/1915/1917 synthase